MEIFKIGYARRIFFPLSLLAILICRNVLAATPIATYADLESALSSSSDITNFASSATISMSTAGETIQITKNTIIDAGSNNVVFDGNNATRLFYVHTNCELVLANVQVINGWSTNQGGAIYSEGTLIISNCIFGGNSVTNTLGLAGSSGNTNSLTGTAGGDGGNAAGGAIYSHGPLWVYYSVFTTNTAAGGAGGAGGSGLSFTNLSNYPGFGGQGGVGGAAYGAAIYSLGTNNIFFATEFLSNLCVAGAGGLGGLAGTNVLDPVLLGGTGPSGVGGPAAGGAVFLGGSLAISNCLFSWNTASGGTSGPAVAYYEGTDYNGVTGGVAAGGGLLASNTTATAYLENTIFYGNVCFGGAGGSASTTTSTGGNGGGADGGGLDIGVGSALIRNCTFATNIVVGGPAGVDTGTNSHNGVAGTTLGWDIFRAAGVVRLANSILAGATESANGVTDAGYNIVSDSSLAKAANSTTRLQTDPLVDSGLSAQSPTLLGPVGTNGMPLLTLALLSGSPATNVIPGVPGLTFPTTDERLLPRKTPASIGAFEVNSDILTVSNQPPADITVEPANQENVHLGETTAFHVVATANPNDPNPLGYQWQLNGTNLPEVGNFSGVNTPDLTISNVTSADLGAYQVVVSPSILDSVATSAPPAYLLVDVPPSIKAQPASHLNVPEGAVVVFKVSVGGAPPFFYQWFSNGVALTDGNEFSGSGTTNLTINPATSADAGSYSVVVSNFYRAVTSSVARLTIVNDTTRPTVTITYPAANSRPTTNVIFGTASDNAQVTNVYCWITNIFGGVSTVASNNAALSAGSTVKTWGLTNVLSPGTNIVVVQSADYSSNVSAKVSHKFFYVVPSEFYLGVSGTGTAPGSAATAGTAPPTNTAILNIGEGYTLTAKPGPGQVLTNWTSTDFVSYTNPLRFTMTTNLSIQANFIASPFGVVEGTYNGLFFNATNGVTFDTAGMLNNLVIGPLGTYSGRLLLDGASYPLSGTFDVFGHATNHFSRAVSRGGSFGFEMDLGWTNNQITGTVSGTNTSWASSLNAEENASAKTSDESTMLLSASTNGAGETPPGFGYVLITNHESHLTLTGALPDGATFSQTVPLGALGDVPLYESLYGNAGLVMGWVTLTNATPQATNGLIWMKPGNKSVFYPGGFTNMLSAQGSSWSNGADFSAAGTLTFSNTSLGLAYPVSIAGNTVTGTPEVKGTVNPKNGLVTLTFETGNGKATLPGHGAILQNTTNLGGYFVTKTNAGVIWLQP